MKSKKVSIFPEFVAFGNMVLAFLKLGAVLKLSIMAVAVLGFLLFSSTCHAIDFNAVLLSLLFGVAAYFAFGILMIPRRYAACGGSSSTMLVTVLTYLAMLGTACGGVLVANSQDWSLLIASGMVYFVSLAIADYTKENS